MQVKVSRINPVSKVKKYLERSLFSTVNQYSAIEKVIVIGGVRNG